MYSYSDIDQRLKRNFRYFKGDPKLRAKGIMTLLT